MEKEFFRESLLNAVMDDISVLQTENKDWVVKGFIDVYKNIYTISADTKVISKIIELLLFPTLNKFAFEHNMEMHFAKQQNHYPDVTFIDRSDNTMYAVDLKSTYKINKDKVNGFTLGAFTGYFRNRESTKNISYSYNSYTAHFVLGVIYNRQKNKIDENKIYSINDLDSILSVVSDFEFLLQEKYRIAATRPGSGNTKNIGSITSTEKLKSGNGPFSTLGEEIFDDYWMYYLTKDIVKDKELGGKPPYSTLKEYCEYKSKIPNIEIIKNIQEE